MISFEPSPTSRPPWNERGRTRDNYLAVGQTNSTCGVNHSNKGTFGNLFKASNPCSRARTSRRPSYPSNSLDSCNENLPKETIHRKYASTSASIPPTSLGRVNLAWVVH